MTARPHEVGRGRPARSKVGSGAHEVAEQIKNLGTCNRCGKRKSFCKGNFEFNQVVLGRKIQLVRFRNTVEPDSHSLVCHRRAGSFKRPRNERAIGERTILTFHAGDTLVVAVNQTQIREDDVVANDLEARTDLLVESQHVFKAIRQSFGCDLVCVSDYLSKKSMLNDRLSKWPVTEIPENEAMPTCSATMATDRSQKKLGTLCGMCPA